MWERLTEVFEKVSSRRNFIGRGSARLVALMAAVFGFSSSKLAKAQGLRVNPDNPEPKCQCGHSYACCCLCDYNDPSCINSCDHTPGACSWAWSCPDLVTGQRFLCYECFWNPGACGGTCDVCVNALCSS